MHAPCVQDHNPTRKGLGTGSGGKGPARVILLGTTSLPSFWLAVCSLERDRGRKRSSRDGFRSAVSRNALRRDLVQAQTRRSVVHYVKHHITRVVSRLTTLRLWTGFNSAVFHTRSLSSSFLSTRSGGLRGCPNHTLRTCTPAPALASAALGSPTSERRAGFPVPGPSNASLPP